MTKHGKNKGVQMYFDFTGKSQDDAEKEYIQKVREMIEKYGIEK